MECFSGDRLADTCEDRDLERLLRESFFFQEESMNTVVLYDKVTKEVIAVGYGDQWVIPCRMDVRGYQGNDEPVFMNVGGRMFLKENALITKID